MSRSRETTLKFSIAPRALQAQGRRGVLTVLSHQAPGRIIPLGDEPITIGRDAEATVFIDDPSLSRVHVRFASMHDAFFIQDLESTNGTFIDGERLTEARMLHDGARIQLGRDTLIRFSLQDEEQLEASRRLYESSVKDALTGAYGRHFLDERLRSDLSDAKRHGRPLCVVFVDLDHFKQVNDTFGHAAGDEVLRRVSKLLVSAVRTEDVVARFGGEELVIVARGITTEGGVALAERLRADIEALEVAFDDKSIKVTASFGVAALEGELAEASAEELVAVADRRLYDAKRDGRNCVRSG